MTLMTERPESISWDELTSAMQETPASPSESFARAIEAVVSSHKVGEITSEEADALLRWAAAQYIAPAVERFTHSLMHWTPDPKGWRGYSCDRSHNWIGLSRYLRGYSRARR